MEFGLFHWSWPGNHQPLHAMIVVLRFLIDFPQAELAPQCRRAVDFILALHETSRGFVAGAEEPIPTRSIAREASEAWKFLFRLRKQAWDAAALDHTILWTRQEAVALCLQEMDNHITNDGILERFHVDDPARGRQAEQGRQATTGGDFGQAQIDALLSGGEDWLFGGLLW